MILGTIPVMFRPARHKNMGLRPITELHCWIAKYADGHEEIVLAVRNGRVGAVGMAMGGRERLLHKRRVVMRAVSKHPDFRSLRFASFYPAG